MSEPSRPPVAPSAHRALALVIAVHGALLAYFSRGLGLLSTTPTAVYDYTHHAYHVDRALAAWERSGTLWGYDPLLLAGHPSGMADDLSSKTLELFVIAATRLGVPTWGAFNVYVLGVHSCVPLTGYISARLFRLAPRDAVWVAAGWVALWHFDSLLHWCWYVGMISWAGAAQLIVLVVALCYRATTEPSVRAQVGLSLAVPALALLHPFAAFTVVPVSLALYWRGRSALSLAAHARMGLAALLALGTSLVWLGPYLQARPTLDPFDLFLHPSPAFIATDWLDLTVSWLMTGRPVRTLLRMGTLVTAAVALRDWRRARDSRVMPLLLLCSVGLALGYGGDLVPFTRSTQPYRQLGPVMLAAMIPAAPLLRELLATTTWRTLSSSGRVALGLGAVLVLPRVVQTAVYYMPDALPKAQRRGPLEHARLSSAVAGFESPMTFMGYLPAPAAYTQVQQYLSTRGRGGRIVVGDWVLGEHLATFARLPVLGGFQDRFSQHMDAHPRRQDYAPSASTPDPFAAYLTRYAVSEVVIDDPTLPMAFRSDLLELAATFGDYRVYLRRSLHDYFLEGAGDVTASLDGIRVTNASGARVVLKFHFFEQLVCRPDCRVVRAEVPHDRIGFISISNPPSSFSITGRHD